MPPEKLIDRLQSTFILDGGMGSQLIARQVQVDRCNEALNLDQAQVIRAIHRDYVEAGSHAVLTNTFGANPLALKRYDLADQTADICRAAVENARFAAGPERYVIGDIGPCGEFLEPLGTLKAADLQAACHVQAEALWSAGVDGFMVETMTALEEVAVVVAAIRVAAPEAPILTSMAFDVNGDSMRTMMGVDVQALVSAAAQWGVTAVGFNCGTATLEEYEVLGGVLATAARASGLLAYGESNAGKPELVGTEPVYHVTPAQFADSAERLCEQGVRILGGCCGTGPEHIRAVAERLGA